MRAVSKILLFIFLIATSINCYGYGTTSETTDSEEEPSLIVDEEVYPQKTKDIKGSGVKEVLVVDNDSRKVAPKGYPYSAMGRLRIRTKTGRAHCTASLVSPCHIVTAGHCLGNFSKEQMSFKGSKIVKETAVGFKHAQRARGDDWALLKLDKPLGKELGYFGLSTKRFRESKVNLSGFHADREGLVNEKAPKIKFKKGNVLCTYADGYGGGSGGAYWSMREKDSFLGIEKKGAYLHGLMVTSLHRRDGNIKVAFSEAKQHKEYSTCIVLTQAFFRKALRAIKRDKCPN